MSPELGVYAGIVLLALGHLTWTGYTYSLQFDVGGKWDGYAPGLKPGWLLGRKMDLSDAQWRDFRSSGPALGAVLSIFAALSRLVQRHTAGSSNARARYYLVFAAIFLGYLHGLCAIYVVALVAANWVVANNIAGAKWGAPAIWGFNVATLLAVRLYDGFPPSLLLGPSFAWLDKHRGVVRWHICFNLTTLRMLSYALDLHWYRLSSKKGENEGGDIKEKSKSKNLGGESKTGPATVATPATTMKTQTQLSAKERQQTPLASETEYSLLLCMAHALYPPLYLAGPIITYQDFAWQLTNSPKSKSKSKSNNTTNNNTTNNNRSPVWRYACRLAADLVCIELVTHFLYFNSLAVHKVGPRLAPHGLEFGAAQVGLTGWWVLTFMWLKFAVIWRTFRLAALAEGIDPPENMMRCFADNYDIEGFWRGWHSSYNRWLVRYMYVPLGGSSRRALSIWPIFLFVALWHDLEARLLSWAWIICLAFLPEMAAKRAAASPKFDSVRHGAGFRAVCAAAAALNIAGLMAANMVGFVVGLDGMVDLFHKLMGSPQYVAGALTSFFSGAQVMFAWREREKERDRKV